MYPIGTDFQKTRYNSSSGLLFPMCTRARNTVVGENELMLETESVPVSFQQVLLQPVKNSTGGLQREFQSFNCNDTNQDIFLK